MSDTKVQASEPSGSKEKDFGIFFYVFICFKPAILLGGSIFNLGTFICINLVKVY